MSDLSFVAGEFPRLASAAREAAEAVRSARPEGGASAFASAMPGTSLSSQMQGVEDKFADQATKTGTSLDARRIPPGSRARFHRRRGRE